MRLKKEIIKELKNVNSMLEISNLSKDEVYRFYVQKNMLKWVLHKRKKTKKEVEDKILPEYGINNPVRSVK